MNTSNVKEKIKLLIDEGNEIPPLPQVALQAIDMVMDNDVDVEKLANLIESDPALSMKLLNLVQRANLGVSKVSSISHAITLLGINIVRYALLGVIIKGISVTERKEILDLQKSLWSHSLFCAILSSLIAEKTYPELKNKAFIGGLLHDIGKAGFIVFFPDDYLKLTEKLTPTTDFFLKEQEYFEVDHSIVGKWIAEKWGLPEEIRDTIQYHHTPIHVYPKFSKHQELVRIVKLANMLAHMFFMDSFYNSEDYFNTLSDLDLKDTEVDKIIDKAKREYGEKASLFDLHTDILELYSDIIDKTRRRLSSVSLELELQNKKLKRLYSFQSILLEFATKLIGINSYDDMFSVLDQVFQKFPNYKIGAVYILHLNEKLFKACIFQKGKKRINVATFLDKNNNPIWDSTSIKFPEGVKRFLSVITAQIHKKLSREIVRNGVLISPPFLFLPFYLSKFGITGELCFVMDEKDKEIDNDEKNLWLQVTGMIHQSLEKIEVLKQLETKTEELTMAFYRNQKFQKRLFETERLASVGQLAAGVAHEINNPLAIISGRVQMLMFSEKDEKKIEQFNQILQQIDRISSLLHKIMDFAKVREPNLTILDIRNLLDKLIDFVKVGFEKKGIIIEKHYLDVPTIKGDISQLEQVFLNLLINAKHALEKTEENPKIEIKVELDKTKEYVVVRIIDNGCGIPKHLIKRVFDPFFTTKEPGKGTGLGLSTSRSIVEQHHGKIVLKSEEGKGTEVMVYLPVNLDKHLEKKKEQTVQISRDITVLIVDDEEHIREILKEILTQEGLNTVECGNGKEALNILDTKKIDVVLLDIKMPVMDGITFLNALKERGHTVPVIVITGWSEDERIREALKEHNLQCIKKPFHIKDVLKAVYRAIAKKE